MKEFSTYEKISWKRFNDFPGLFGVGAISICTALVFLTVEWLRDIKISNSYPVWPLIILVALIVSTILLLGYDPSYGKKYQNWFEVEGKVKFIAYKNATKFAKVVNLAFWISAFFILTDLINSMVVEGMSVKNLLRTLLLASGALVVRWLVMARLR
jgi:hypothetical protein